MFRTAVYQPGPDGTTMCGHCPVLCKIKPGGQGACKMYGNLEGKVVRARPLTLEKERPQTNWEEEAALSRPLIYAWGAGTEYPDFVPAPGIIEAEVNGVDVVTCVTEAPLSYCSVKVKIDTNLDIGHEGAPVTRDGRVVGHVTTEEYGAKMLSVGGVHLISQKGGLHVAKTMAEICNREPVVLEVEGGAAMELQVGEAPLINGVRDAKMRVGCGSATLGIFGPQLAEIADETIVIDPHITGLLTEHAVGRSLGLRFSGITPVGRRSSIGRYFGDAGAGWGGTTVMDPRDAIARVDMTTAWPGLTVFLVDTNGQRAALLELQPDGQFTELPLTGKAVAMREMIAASSEPAMVSALFVGGIGGSARAGISTAPMEVNRAVHGGQVKLTVCGAPTSLLPGGNIIFTVDVGKVPQGAFYVTPTPAVIVPFEYTMTRPTFEQIRGRREALQTRGDFLRNREVEWR